MKTAGYFHASKDNVARDFKQSREVNSDQTDWKRVKSLFAMEFSTGVTCGKRIVNAKQHNCFHNSGQIASY